MIFIFTSELLGGVWISHSASMMQQVQFHERKQLAGGVKLRKLFQEEKIPCEKWERAKHIGFKFEH
jgi:hypothetical protein